MRALILDRTHSVLLDRGSDGAHQPDVPVDQRPLRDLSAALAARGVTLPAPSGSRARSDGQGRDFAFVIDRIAAPDRMTWRPLAEVLAAHDAIWELYVELMLGGWLPSTRALDVWSFGDEPEMAAKLVHLVMCGEKRVTMGWIEGAERDGIPLARAGGVNVVTDGFGYPRVVLRSADVRVVPFDEIDAASAAGEGEGDLTYADWREDHIAFFTRQAARFGVAFDERARISVERFEVLHVIGSASAAA